VVAEQLLQILRRAGLLGQQAGIKNQRLIGNKLSFGESLSAESQQAHHERGNGIGLAEFVGNEEVMFFPGAVKERDNPVIEQLEEVAQGVVLLLRTLQDQLGIGRRQNALRRTEPYEI